ncbi:hypothetical protein JCM19992_18740 [Thermostilla marina]
MGRPLFVITCTTCQAKLQVRDPSVIGAIVACPKCESMVQVTPPPGWEIPSEPEASATPEQALPRTGGDAASSQPQEIRAQVDPERAEKSSANRCDPSPVGAAAVGGTAADIVQRQSEPPAETGKDLSLAAGESSETHAADSSAADVPDYVSPIEAAARRWLYLVGGGAAVLVVGIAVWFALPRRIPTPTSKPETVPAPSESPQAVSSEKATVEEPALVEAETAEYVRWIPQDSVFVMHGRLVDWPRVFELIEFPHSEFAELWPDLLGTLRIGPDAVEYVTFACVDAAHPAESCVAVLELREGHDANALAVEGEAVPFSVDGKPVRRFASTKWSHPVVVVDSRILVTGRDDLLRRLPRMPELKDDGDSPAWAPGRLPPSSGERLFAVDLEAMRKAGRRLPDWWADVDPDSAEAWHTVWAVGRWFVAATALDEEALALLFRCETPEEAKRVYDALQQMSARVLPLLDRQEQLLQERLKAGSLPADAASVVDLVLTNLREGLNKAKCEQIDADVWYRLPRELIEDEKMTVLEAALPVFSEHRAAAGYTLDCRRHEALGGSCAAYLKAEKAFPPAAVGGGLVPPQTRLSWLALMLPYMGHLDWSEQLQPGYSWNSVQNRPIARRELPEVINPVFGRTTALPPYPDTHYVGVTGVGEGAGMLPADDPKAGVFSFVRRTRLEDIGDGASNTIAVLGAAANRGPWASGGTATARSLTKPPYVDGPDGFGSGQPGGMLALMADGSVRFVRRDVDDRVLEQLATINGGESATVDVLIPAQDYRPFDMPKEEEKPPKPGDVESATPSGAPNVQPGEVVELPAIDVAARLSLSAAKLQSGNATLGEFIGVLSRLTGVPISLDLDALEAVGESAGSVPDIVLQETDVASALDALAETLGLEVRADDYGVRLTLPDERRRVIEIEYGADRLPGKSATEWQAAAKIAQEMVAPSTWADVGGDGTIRVAGDGWIVNQTPLVHARLSRFLEEWNRLRRMAAAGPVAWRDVRRINPWLAVDESLNTPVTILRYEMVPCERILADINAETDLTVVADWYNLRAVGVRPNRLMTFAMQKQPLGAVLEQFAIQLEGRLRAVDDRTIEITLPSIADRDVWAWFPVDEFLAAGWTVGRIREAIVTNHAPESWENRNSEAAIAYDEDARTFVVRHKPTVIRQIVQWGDKELGLPEQAVPPESEAPSDSR